MTQYIKKDALVAEIERLKADALQKKSLCKRSGLEKIMHQIGVYNKILSFLGTLDVKEVDLEKEIQRQYNVHKNPDNSIVKDCVIMTKDGFEYFAKHFFELGMSVNNKAQKGE